MPQTFIFVHDQEIVLDYIRAGKFNDLPNLKYIFLGSRPVDKIEGVENVVVARHLPYHIEDCPNLLAWTGWYAIVENGLIESKLINLFEYDVNIIGKWDQPQGDVAYFQHKETCEVWWNYNGIQPQLEEIMGKRATIHLRQIPMTSCYTLSSGRLEKIISKLLYEIPCEYEHPYAGHIAERLCSYWLRQIKFAPGKLEHLYADSHNTQGRGDQYEKIKDKLIQK